MSPYSPLSALIGAARLRQDGHGVSHFDATFGKGVGAFKTALAKDGAPIVALLEDNFHFITKMCTAARRRDALAMVAAAKHAGRLVLVNGPDSADRPEVYLAAGADAVLLGDGEAALLEIAALWRDNPGAPLDGITGLVLPQNSGTVRRTRPRLVQPLPDVLPAWDLLNIDAYRTAWRGAHGRFSWNVVTSRGCPYGCNWCAKPTFGRGYQQRSAEAVAREL